MARATVRVDGGDEPGVGLNLARVDRVPSLGHPPNDALACSFFF